MTYLPILTQTKLTRQSSTLLVSYSCLPHSSIVSAVVAAGVVVVGVGVGVDVDAVYPPSNKKRLGT